MIRKIVSSLGVVALLMSVVVVSGCADKKPPEEDAAAEAAAESGAGADAAGADGAAAASADLGEEDIPMGNMSTVDSQGRVRKDVLSANDSAMEGAAGSASDQNLLVPAALFAFDSSTLDSKARAILDEVAALLSKNGSWVVTLEGHCDERGTEEYNLGLGQRRAEAAKRYLLQKGISSGRIDTVSFGEAYPVDARSNEAAWAKNRRVHFAFAKGSAS